MTSDIRKLINESSSAFARGEGQKSLRREVAGPKTSAGCKRELDYIRGLSNSIKMIRCRIVWLKLTRAPVVKIERVETKLNKRRAKLVSETGAVEAGWLDAWNEDVRSNQMSRFYWLGVTAFKNNYNLTKICSNASLFILRDNWGSKSVLKVDRIPVEETSSLLAGRGHFASACSSSVPDQKGQTFC